MRHDSPLLRIIASASLVLALAGCRIDTHRGDNGEHHVSIQTPVGGMNVKTDAAVLPAKLGLPAYPGAVSEKHNDKDDNGSADVDLSFGDFHLRVLAAAFTTPDSPDRVRTFYTGALAQYGDVLECRNDQPVGNLKRTGQGLTCAHDKHVHSDIQSDNAHIRTNAGDTELKAGSPSRQHIVSFSPKDGGTRFGLVSLEIPHGFGDS